MKKIFLLAILSGLVGLTSCQKCADCSCTYEDSFTFGDGFPTDQELIIRSAYDNSSTYLEVNTEVCSKRGTFNDSISAFEAQSVTFKDEGTRDGISWSYNATYTCKCDK